MKYFDSCRKMNRKKWPFFIALFFIFAIGCMPASATLEQGIDRLNKMWSEIQMIEEQLAKKALEAKGKDILLIKDLTELKQQIEVLGEALNLSLDEQEPIRNKMRRKVLEGRLDLLQYSLGVEEVRDSEQKLTFLQNEYLQTLGISDISYEDLEFSRYVSRIGKDKISEADMLPFFEKKLMEEFTEGSLA